VIPSKNIKIINTNTKNTKETVLLFKPDIIGFSVVSPAFPKAVQLATIIKKEFNGIMIIGGHHITGAPELFDAPFDVGVIGEGEGPLEDIVRLVQNNKNPSPSHFSTIPNLVYKVSDGKIVANPMRPLLKPNEIPPNIWSLLRPEEIVGYETVIENSICRTTLGAQIFTSRGCPYQCVFCARTVIWKTGAGFRLLSMDHIIADIEYLYRKLHITSLTIYDDTFAVSKARIRILIQELRKKGILGNIVLPYVFVRANLIDEEFVQLLKELGVLSVFMGIESGSKRMLKYLKNDSLTLAQVKKAVRLFAKYDIRVTGSFMLFVPGEKPIDLDKTHSMASWLAHEPNPYAIGMYVTVPYPGTKLWEDTIVKEKRDIASLPWQNFVTYDPKQFYVNKVFFRNGFTDKQLTYYWFRVYKQRMYIENLIAALPGWKESTKEVTKLNKRISSSLEMKERITRVLHNPIRLFTRFRHKQVWRYVAKDIRLLTGIKI